VFGGPQEANRPWKRLADAQRDHNQRLTLQIYRIIRERGLTQAQAAKVLGVKQPHVSLLMRNRSGSFSAGRLMEFLTALGQDVEITVRPARKEHGEMSVMVS